MSDTGSEMQAASATDRYVAGLREENERLRAALDEVERIAWGKDTMVSGRLKKIVERCREARCKPRVGTLAERFEERAP